MEASYDITDAGAQELRASGGTKMLFGCSPNKLKAYLHCECDYFIAYQSAGGLVQAGTPDRCGLAVEDRTSGSGQLPRPDPAVVQLESGRVKGLYKQLTGMEIVYRDQNKTVVAGRSAAEIRNLSPKDALSYVHGLIGEDGRCVVSFAVKKITDGITKWCGFRHRR